MAGGLDITDVYINVLMKQHVHAMNTLRIVDKSLVVLQTHFI